MNWANSYPSAISAPDSHEYQVYFRKILPGVSSKWLDHSFDGAPNRPYIVICEGGW